MGSPLAKCTDGDSVNMLNLRHQGTSVLSWAVSKVSCAGQYGKGAQPAARSADKLGCCRHLQRCPQGIRAATRVQVVFKGQGCETPSKRQAQLPMLPIWPEAAHLSQSESESPLSEPDSKSESARESLRGASTSFGLWSAQLGDKFNQRRSRKADPRQSCSSHEQLRERCTQVVKPCSVRPCLGLILPEAVLSCPTSA